jgi:hypothetical protein
MNGVCVISSREFIPPRGFAWRRAPRRHCVSSTPRPLRMALRHTPLAAKPTHKHYKRHAVVSWQQTCSNCARVYLAGIHSVCTGQPLRCRKQVSTPAKDLIISSGALHVANREGRRAEGRAAAGTTGRGALANIFPTLLHATSGLRRGSNACCCTSSCLYVSSRRYLPRRERRARISRHVRSSCPTHALCRQSPSECCHQEVHAVRTLAQPDTAPIESLYCCLLLLLLLCHACAVALAGLSTKKFGARLLSSCCREDECNEAIQVQGKL